MCILLLYCVLTPLCVLCVPLCQLSHTGLSVSLCVVWSVCVLCVVYRVRITPLENPLYRPPLYKTHRKTPSDSLQSYCTIRFGFLSTVSKKCVDMLKGLTFGKLRAKTPIPPHLKRYREHFKIYLHIFLILRHSPISLTSYIIPFKINQFFNCYPYESKILIYDIMVISPHLLLYPIV